MLGRGHSSASVLVASNVVVVHEPTLWRNLAVSLVGSRFRQQVGIIRVELEAKAKGLHASAEFLDVHVRAIVVPILSVSTVKIMTTC